MIYLTAGFGYGIHSVLRGCPCSLVVILRHLKSLVIFSSSQNFENLYRN